MGRIIETHVGVAVVTMVTNVCGGHTLIHWHRKAKLIYH